MRKKKILKSFLWVIGLLAGLVLIALETGSRIYQERAAAYFQSEFSQKSDLVLEPFQTSISVWRHFPRITFTFRHVSFLDTTGGTPFRVLFVGRAEVAVPLTQFRPGRLKISRVNLEEVLFHQKIDSAGNKTGLRFRKIVHPDTTSDKLPFIVPRLQIRNARILSENQFKKSAFALQIREANLALRLKGKQLHIGGRLAGKIEHLTSKKLRLFPNHPFTAQVDYTYLLNRKRGVFRNTRALLHQNMILIRGWHQALPDGPGARLNLTLSGDQPLMALFREVLPPQTQPFLNRLQTNSRLHLMYRITGNSGPRQRPRNQLFFTLKNGTFYLPASKKYIRQANLKGFMDNGPQHGPQSSRFRISQLSGGTGRDRFVLSLEVNNFLQPSFTLQGQGQMNLPAVASFITLPFASVTRGSVSGAFRLRGNLPDTLGQVRSNWRGQGIFQVREAAFQPLGLAAKCQGVHATVRYTDSLLQLQNLSGTIGGYPFKMQATVRNYTAYLFNEPGSLLCQASIYAQRLDLNWFRDTGGAAPQTASRLEREPVSSRQKAGKATSRSSRPNGKSAPGAPAGQNRPPTWRSMQTQVNLVVTQVKIPGREQVKNLAVKINQQGERVTLTRMRFRTTRGGLATAQGGFRLIPGGISRPYLDVRVHYSFLNLQAFMQNLTAFKQDDPGRRNSAAQNKKIMEDYLDKRYWLNLHIKANRLQYLYLQGSDLVLAANMNRQRTALSRLHLQTLGGRLEARGDIQLNGPGNYYPLYLRAQVRNIDLQQLFRVAEQMQVDLLSSRNIRGTADCQLTVITRLDKTFAPSFDRTVAHARTIFRSMELIEVAPIQQALRFLRRERTSHLYFQDVHTSFILDANKFLTPGFDLNSNLTDFRLSGSYTMGGGAHLNMDVNVLSVLFGNNKRRIEKIQADSASADTLEAPKTGRKQHLLVYREQNNYKVKLSNRKARDEDARALRAEYSNLIRQHGIDTVFRMK